MKATWHAWENVVSTVYQLDKGETVNGKHNHPGYAHTTQVVRGSTQVEIYGRTITFPDDQAIGLFMKPGDIYIMPPDLYHLITAQEDDTIVLNCIHVNGTAGGDGGRGKEGIIIE